MAKRDAQLEMAYLRQTQCRRRRYARTGRGLGDEEPAFDPQAWKNELEATTGFEPVDGCFADPCLTTWLHRRVFDSSILD